MKGLAGNPDIVFLGARVAIFCDGDFWHGRDWEARRRKLGRGNNASYWLAKIERNIERDWQNTQKLLDQGWTVLHVWESDIRSDSEGVARDVLAILHGKADRRFVALDSGVANGVNRT